MKLDQDIRDVQMSVIPVESAESHLLLITKPGTSEREAPSKKILDLTGAKKFLYPTSIQSPELKVDRGLKQPGNLVSIFHQTSSMPLQLVFGTGL
ncbi:unnamed protein product, partial [Vitis vinifera]